MLAISCQHRVNQQRRQREVVDQVSFIIVAEIDEVLTIRHVGLCVADSGGGAAAGSLVACARSGQDSVRGAGAAESGGCAAGAAGSPVCAARVRLDSARGGAAESGGGCPRRGV